MKKVAIVGASGTGKTSIINELKRKYCNEWMFVSESTRSIVPILGYRNPWDIVNEHGIAFYEAIIISQWCIIDHLYGPSVCVLDRSPIDNLAYYYSCRTETEVKHENILASLALHYASKIDLFILVRSGVFPFERDEMRLVDLQIQHEAWLLRILRENDLKFHELIAVDIENRALEVEATISSFNRL